MKKLFCRGTIKEKYPIYISEDKTFKDLISLLPAEAKKFIIIDKKVIDLFPDLTDLLKGENVFLFPIVANEDNKTLGGLENLCREIFVLKPSRDDIVIVIGGGLVMNLGGLTASLIMRGIRFYYVPTTLTGQIDASLGSKQAVNFMGAKNWIGIYNDPEFCYVNAHFLRTIPKWEMNSQAVEGIKLCLATNKNLFFEIFETIHNFPLQTFEQLSTFTETMIEAKIPVVEKDLLEENYGMSMLYGHTVGHAIEMLDHEHISHGEAVGLGMLVAAKISHLLGFADKNLVTIHEEILSRLHLPTKIPRNIFLSAIEEMLLYNKRNYNGEIRFVLLRDIGEMVEQNGDYYTIVPKDFMVKAIQDCYHSKP